MLTLFSGEDGVAVKKRLNGELERLKREYPGAPLLRATEPASIPAVTEYASQSGLFGDPAIVVIDELFSHKDAEALLGVLPDLVTSESHFLAFERKPKKDLRDAIERKGGKIVEVTGMPAKRGTKEALPFALTDAIIRKEKRVAWMELLRLRRTGAVPEMLHGTIFWAIKSLLFAKEHTASEAVKLGLNRSSIEKFSRSASKWEREELVGTIENLVDMQHEAHSGGASLDIRLERFVLGIKS